MTSSENFSADNLTKLPDAPDALDAPAGTPLVELAADVDEAAPAGPAGRRLPGHRSRILLEQGDEIVEIIVRVDNRDYLRWDKTAPRAKWGSAKDVPFLVSTFTSWAAAKRTGAFDGPFEVFEKQCLEVSEVTDDAEDDVTRPTR